MATSSQGTSFNIIALPPVVCEPIVSNAVHKLSKSRDPIIKKKKEMFSGLPILIQETYILSHPDS